MEDWVIKNGKIDAVISMNDNMAAGAIEAVKGKKEFAKMQAYGVDGTPEAALLIKTGKMTATSLQSAGDLAKLNLATVHDLLTKKKSGVIEANIPAPLIEKSNAQSYLTLYKKAGLIK
jgi:inositol transport system substrate-binding protein